MTTPTTTHDVEEYLAEVRQHLSDLNDEERAELLEDLKQHLSDVGEEEAGVSLRERLGEPASYANELRTAAGLSPSAEAAAPVPDRVALRRVLGDGVRGVKQVAVDLRPAWWVVRGALLAALPFWWRPDGNDDFPVPSPFGMPGVGLLVLLLGVGLSVWTGRSADQPKWRRVGMAANGVLLAALALGSVLPHDSATQYARVSRVPRLVTLHGPVTNIYPYDAEGRPLDGVLLYDQDGRPLKADFQEWWADRCPREPEYPLAADGVPVEFSYPRRYALVGQRADFQFGQDGRATTSGPQCMTEIPRPAVPLPLFPPPPPPDGASAP